VTVTGVTGWRSDKSGRYFTCNLDDFIKAVGPVNDDTVYNVRHKPIGNDRYEWCGPVKVFRTGPQLRKFYGRRDDRSGNPGQWKKGDTIQRVEKCNVTVTGVTGWRSDKSGRYFTFNLDDFKKAVGPVDEGTVYNVRHKPIGNDRDEWCGPVIVFRTGPQLRNFYGRRDDRSGNPGQWKEGDTFQRVDKCRQ